MKWAALVFALSASAFAAAAGSIWGAVNALIAGALGFLAVVYTAREQKANPNA